MHYLRDIPLSLKTKLSLYDKYIAPINHTLQEAACLLLLTSEYSRRQIAILRQLLIEDPCLKAMDSLVYKDTISNLSLTLPLTQFSKELRAYRHRHLLRLHLRHLAGLAILQETMASWSDCADALILHVLNYSIKQYAKRYGYPCDKNKSLVHFLVIAMGKLGGKELNFSSDIDLIFCYSADGYTNGHECIRNEQFYIKVVQHFLQCMQVVTKDGIVFRVDLRLRPYGDSGPLVSSFAAMETYYQEQGRNWERYAMVKARCIQDDDFCQTWFKQFIIPFVYRRYVDFSVIEALRGMKEMIAQSLPVSAVNMDIKRGHGGIREIEFIIQSVQLIRGGRLPFLQQTSTMMALQAIKKHQLLDIKTVKDLKRAYLFLRNLENVLQIHQDQHTHHLPQDSLIQVQIALAMKYHSWDNLIEDLDNHRNYVKNLFHQILHNEEVYIDEKRLLTTQLLELWQGQIEQAMAVNLCMRLGFQEPMRCYQLLYDFRHSARIRRLSQSARMRLDRLMVVLLKVFASISINPSIITSTLHVLEHIVGRSTYLALLIENQQVVHELLQWITKSQFIAELLMTYPFLLEQLVHKDRQKPLPGKIELKLLLQKYLENCQTAEDNTEYLRQFKLICWLKVACAELNGACDALAAGKYLAHVAEVILDEVVLQACSHLSFHYPMIWNVKKQFAIVAYGKLAAKELNYDSDVDLVFLHTAPSSQEAIITRLAQKILHILTLRTQSGVLYQVDTRLRPSGSAGLLVSSLHAYLTYQRERAWMWEHQALLRSQLVVGNRTFQYRFLTMRYDILSIQRNKPELQNSIKSMRTRIDKYTHRHNIKHASGGLVDLEFLVQFLLLSKPVHKRVLSANTELQLQYLYSNKSITHKQKVTLHQAYQFYHEVLHKQILLHESPYVDDHLERVQDIINLLMGGA